MSNNNFGYDDNYPPVSNCTQALLSSHQHFPTLNASTAPYCGKERMLERLMPVAITTSMDSIDSATRRARTIYTTGTSTAAPRNRRR